MSAQLKGTTSETIKRYKILAAVMLGGIMGPIDSSIVNIILPTIANHFGVSIATVQWVPLIYLLTISSLLLFYGRLGDIFGYKRIYITGLTCFIVATFLCGLAPAIHWFIVARAVQGIGAGMVMSVPYAILTAVFRPEERGRALGINAISISAGLAIGPALGGLLASIGSWRLAFMLNVPIGLAALFWGVRIIPDLRGQRGRIDIAGAVSAFVCLFSFLFFVNQVQRTGVSFINSIAIMVAVIAGVFFLYWERHTLQPMLNLSLFKNRAFTLGTASALSNFASQYVMVFLTPFYLQRVIHYSPDKIGFLMTCFPFAVMSVAPFSGALSDRLGTRGLAVTGAAICAATLASMTFLSVEATAGAIGWRLALFGLGTGIFQSPNNSAVMGSVPRPHLGVASGTLSMVRNVGMAMGISAAGLVLYSLVPPTVVARDYLAGAGAALFLGGLKYAYMLGAGLSALAALFSIMQVKGIIHITPNVDKM